MTKIAITGHTRGVGKILFDHFSPDIIGFSKSTGFDLTIAEHRKNIITATEDCDVFINNVYTGSCHEIEMLYDLFEVWQNQNKLIINIGSESSSGIKKSIYKYSAYKAALDKASEQLSFLNKNCQVINIRFGWIGTDRVLSLFNPDSYLSGDEVSDIIQTVILNSSRFRITDVLVRPK